MWEVSCWIARAQFLCCCRGMSWESGPVVAGWGQYIYIYIRGVTKWKTRLVFEETKILWRHILAYTITTHDPNTVDRMLYNRVGSETQKPWKWHLCYTTGREITIREVIEWITRHNRGYPTWFGSSKRQFMDWRTVTGLMWLTIFPYWLCYKTPTYPELQNKIYVVCDTSFADDQLTRKSQQGHLIFYNCGPILKLSYGRATDNTR